MTSERIVLLTRTTSTDFPTLVTDGDQEILLDAVGTFDAVTHAAELHEQPIEKVIADLEEGKAIPVIMKPIKISNPQTL